MAFNFNWSPLIADTSRARDMLTAALNKSPKPPIIVDDIIVTELNLGSVPPELDILEIGDLAEDRFRGIFKMSYAGDAFLTLKTRVQANPLNTYLSTKPNFASPQPLAAASGLTIPLQITLSDIRLSGFIILVFSRQKGITLVFRNDPLEALKVSSTFDSIPFVRNYLQKEIEGQLRVLFMEDLPAIIHRLSLRLWVPEYAGEEATAIDSRAEHRLSSAANQPSSPSKQPFVVDDSREGTISPPFPDTSIGGEHSTYSHRIVLRLAALTDSYRTLSLFTPPINEAIFRAWAGAAERGEQPVAPSTSFSLSSLVRRPSAASVTSLQNLSEAGHIRSTGSSHVALSGLGNSSVSGKSRSHGNKKRKKRVVNLRRPKPVDTDASDTESRPSTPTSTYTSRSGTTSEIREGELITPDPSPPREHTMLDDEKTPGASISRINAAYKRAIHFDDSVSHTSLDAICQDPIPSPSLRVVKASIQEQENAEITPRPPHRHTDSLSKPTQNATSTSTSADLHAPRPISAFNPSQGQQLTGRILEQAWMAKMAAEMARKLEDQKGGSSNGFWSSDIEGEDSVPPPAYAA